MRIVIAVFVLPVILFSGMLDSYMMGILPSIAGIKSQYPKQAYFTLQELQNSVDIKDASGNSIFQTGNIGSYKVIDTYQSMVKADKNHFYTIGIKGDLVFNGVYTHIYNEPLAQLCYEEGSLYLLKYSGQIDILDISHSSTPQYLKSIANGKQYHKIEVDGAYLYALTTEGYLDIFNAQTAAYITTLQNQEGYLYTDFSVSDEKIVLTTHNGLLDVYNQATTPDAVTHDTTYDLPAQSLVLDGHYLAVIKGTDSRHGELLFIDLNAGTSMVNAEEADEIALDRHTHTFVALKEAGDYPEYSAFQIRDSKVYRAQINRAQAIYADRITPSGENMPGYSGGLLYSDGGYLYTTDFFDDVTTYPLPKRDLYTELAYTGTALTKTTISDMFQFPEISYFNYKEKPYFIDDRLALIPIPNAGRSEIYLIDYKANRVLSYYYDHSHRAHPYNSIAIDNDYIYINTGFAVDVIRREGDKLAFVQKVPFYHMETGWDNTLGSICSILSTGRAMGMTARNGTVFVEGDNLDLHLSKLDLSDPAHPVYNVPVKVKDGVLSCSGDMVTDNSGNGVIMRLYNNDLYLYDLGWTGMLGEYEPQICLLQNAVVSNPEGIGKAVCHRGNSRYIDVAGKHAFWIKDGVNGDGSIGYSGLDNLQNETALSLSSVPVESSSVFYDGIYYYLLADNAMYLLQENSGGALVEKETKTLTFGSLSEISADSDNIFIISRGGMLYILDNNVSSDYLMKKTGQTKSYDSEGDEVTDGSIKDDGFYQKGVDSHYSRNNDTQIVTDYITRLQWQDDERVGSETKTWSDARNYCQNDVRLGGYSDWRLPTLEELETIVDYAKASSIDSTYFMHIDTDYYWTDTEYVGSSDVSWNISFMNADGGDYRAYKTREYHVRCVRND